MTKQSKYRKIAPSAAEAKGRSIVQILFDRSIHGPRGVGGIRPLHFYQDEVNDTDNDDNDGQGTGTGTGTGTASRDHPNYLGSNSSPSSVIHEEGEGEEGEAVLTPTSAQQQQADGGGESSSSSSFIPPPPPTTPPPVQAPLEITAKIIIMDMDMLFLIIIERRRRRR